MENNGEFGISRQKNTLERRIGQYVLIYANQKFFAGKIMAIDQRDGYITLNPAHNVSYETGRPVQKIIDSDNDIKIENIFAIETISRKGLEGYCAYFNKKFNREKRRKKKKIGINNK